MTEVARSNTPQAESTATQTSPSPNTGTGTGATGRDIAANALQEASIHLGYADAANDLYDAMKGGITGWGTDETKVMTTLEGLSKLPAENKKEFLDFYARTHNGETLESHLREELNGKDYTDAMLKFLGDDPALSADRAAIVAARIDDASVAEIKTLLSGRSPEEMKLINDNYAAAHNGTTLVSKFQKMPINIQQKVELISQADGTPEGAVASRLYYYARNNPEHVQSVLRGIEQAGNMAQVEAKFKSMFPEVKTDLETYLRRNAPSEEIAAAYDQALDALEEKEYNKGKSSEIVEKVDPPADTVEVKAEEKEVEAEVSEPPVESKTREEINRDRLREAEGETVVQDQKSYNLELNQKALSTAKSGSLMEFVSHFEAARTSGNIDSIQQLKNRLKEMAQNLEGQEKLKSWFDTASSWNPDNPLKGTYGDAEKTAIYAHRRELHLDILDLIRDPANFDTQKALLSGEGIELAAYTKRKAEMLVEGQDESLYADARTSDDIVAKNVA